MHDRTRLAHDLHQVQVPIPAENDSPGARWRRDFEAWDRSFGREFRLAWAAYEERVEQEKLERWLEYRRNGFQ